MRVTEAPVYDELSLDNIHVFLAGGITGCPEWQGKLIEMLSDLPDDVVLFNPRRVDFPMGDPDAGLTQIKWEFDMLDECDIFSMWFCKETIQPICMYELGRCMARWEFGEKPDCVTIGVDPDYERRLDVEVQTKLICEDTAKAIASTLEDHSANIRELVSLLKEKT